MICGSALPDAKVPLCLLSFFAHIKQPDCEKDQHRTENKQALGVAEKDLHNLGPQCKLESFAGIGVCQEASRLHFPVGQLQADRSREACGVDQKPQRMEDFF